MPAYVKQHYVPRFYLNYFATPESQRHLNKKRWQIYVHHKDFDETTADPPLIPEVAYGDWYYERDNDQDKFMESSLGDIETLAGEVIKKINETRDVSWIKPRDKKRLADFVAVQHVRVPKQRGLGYRSLIERDFPGYSLCEDQAHLYVMMREDYPILGFNIPLTPTLLLVTRPKESFATDMALSSEDTVKEVNFMHVVQSYQQLYASTPDFGDYVSC